MAAIDEQIYNTLLPRVYFIIILLQNLAQLLRLIFRVLLYIINHATIVFNLYAIVNGGIGAFQDKSVRWQAHTRRRRKSQLNASKASIERE